MKQVKSPAHSNRFSNWNISENTTPNHDHSIKKFQIGASIFRLGELLHWFSEQFPFQWKLFGNATNEFSNSEDSCTNGKTRKLSKRWTSFTRIHTNVSELSQCNAFSRTMCGFMVSKNSFPNGKLGKLFDRWTGHTCIFTTLRSSRTFGHKIHSLLCTNTRGALSVPNTALGLNSMYFKLCNRHVQWNQCSGWPSHRTAGYRFYGRYGRYNWLRVNESNASCDLFMMTLASPHISKPSNYCIFNMAHWVLRSAKQ